MVRWPDPSPLERAEQCYEDLVQHYGDSDDQVELRAAAKLLIIALAKFRDHGGENWPARVEEYLTMARDEPDRFRRVVAGNRRTRPM